MLKNSAGEAIGYATCETWFLRIPTRIDRWAAKTMLFHLPSARFVRQTGANYLCYKNVQQIKLDKNIYFIQYTALLNLKQEASSIFTNSV